MAAHPFTDGERSSLCPGGVDGKDQMIGPREKIRSHSPPQRGNEDQAC